jgi:hypothetical protein
MFKPSFLIFIVILAVGTFGQSELLTNAQVIEMTEAGLSPEIVSRKVRTTNTNFDLTSAGLIGLKKANVTDSVIKAMIDRQEVLPPNRNLDNTPAYSESGSTPNSIPSTSDAAPAKKTILGSAKSIAFEKSSLQPSRQALEKEMLKRPEFKKLNLSILRYRDAADLYVEIGFVHGSVITHRYAYRIYDRRSGSVLAAGETTSWGSLAENLARRIAKSLAAVQQL